MRQEEADSEALKDPLAATIAAEVSADDAAQAEGQGSSNSPIQPHETVNTGSQHVLKVLGVRSVVLVKSTGKQKVHFQIRSKKNKRLHMWQKQRPFCKHAVF